MSVDGEPLVGADHRLPMAAKHARRSALGVAISVTHLTRLLVAWLASFPVVAAVGASGILNFEPGDGKLFEPGGLYLLEVLLRERAMLVELVAPTAALLAVGALVGVLPEWLLLRALASPATAALDGPTLSRGLLRLGALALGSWVARGVLAFVTGALAMTARSYFVSARDERLGLLATAAVVLLGLAGWACLSVLHDRAAIGVAVGGAPPLVALERALLAVRRHTGALAVRYAAWALASSAVLVGGAAAAGSFDVTAGGSLPAAAALLLHQLTLLAQIGLHAAWLSSLLAATPERVDGPAR
jgi:hypothetical protein